MCLERFESLFDWHTDCLHQSVEEECMAPVAAPAPPPAAPPAAPARPAEAPFDFHCLVIDLDSNVRNWTTTLSVSFLLHLALVVVIVIVPILTYNALPEPGGAVRAFFVAPAEAAPPPPPPPPPAPAAARTIPRPQVAPPPTDGKFVAPIEVPDEIKPEEGLDLGVEGGVPGGVEGGVPGGVLGGIVGGLPAAAPPPPAPKAVRVGGQIKQPKILNRVEPVYPDLAQQARLSAIIIMEALVGTDGRVKKVTVLRGAPLFDEPAMTAVRQWRYQPLLLNGIPTEFILTVTVNFNLTQK